TRSKRDWSSDVCSSDLKQILDLPMMNAIITIAKDKGCDIDGDIVHVGEDSYYVHIFNNEVAKCYVTNKIDRIIHILSIIAYLAKIGRASCRERMNISVE